MATHLLLWLWQSAVSRLFLITGWTSFFSGSLPRCFNCRLLSSATLHKLAALSNVSSDGSQSNLSFIRVSLAPKTRRSRIMLSVCSPNSHNLARVFTLGTRGNSLAKSGRPKAGETSVRSEVSEVSEGPNASSLWWRTPMVSLCLIQILYLITDWLFKNVFLPATAVGQKRSREMNRFFQ